MWTCTPFRPTVTFQGGCPGEEKACNALLIYPRFDADTFWNFKRTAEVFGAKYSASPLGLITVAALLPRSWSIRLVNRNTEDLSDADLVWADVVFTGGMLPQQSDTLDVVDFSHAHGKPVVTAGFIFGFDSETELAAEAMIELIEEAAIPVCMVGLLYALPHTQLERRLEKEGRLFPHPERKDLKTADQCTMGLNFKTLRPRQEVLADYAYILERIYDPVAYAGRLQRLARMLDNSGRKRQTRATHSRRKLGSLEMLHRIMTNLPEPREVFRSTLTQCMSDNPDSIRWVVALMALYLHVGPFSHDVIARIENIVATIEPLAIEPRAPVELASSNLVI